MKIEVFYIPNCPNHSLAIDRLREILPPEMFSTTVREVLVNDLATAESLGFPGSPTIRINGDDVEPQTTQRIGLMCRLYSDGTGAPSRERLRAVIEQAAASKD